VLPDWLGAGGNSPATACFATENNCLLGFGSLLNRCDGVKFSAAGITPTEGNSNPGSEAIAMLWAQPMPVSSIPPHHAGTAR